MVEIKAGAELDRAVAEALGMIFDVSDCKVELLILSEEDSGIAELVPFAPSKDLNDAFYASEQAGLFTHNRALRVNRYHWEIIESGDPLERVVSKGDTPALAICAAILALSK